MRNRVLSSLTTLAAALVVASPAGATGWADPVRLSTPGAAHWAPYVHGSGDGVFTSEGETVVAWKEFTASRFGTLRAHVRSDDGSEATSDLATNVEQHDLAEGGDGTVAAAWVTLPGAPAQYSAGHVEVAIRPPHGEFASPVRLASGDWGDVAVAVNADGDVAVLWGFGAELRISVKPAGGAWTPSQVVPGAQRGEDIDVALTPDGDAIIAAEKDSTHPNDDLALTTRRADGTFTAVDSYEGGPDRVDALADDAGGAAVLSWMDGTPHVMFREDDGGFGPRQHLGLSVDYRRYSTPVVTPAGDFLILQAGNDLPHHEPGLYLVRGSTGNRTLATPQRLGGGGLTEGRMAVRDDGTALLAWTDYDRTETRVRHADGTLGPTRVVSCAKPTAAAPVPLGLDADGHGVLALAQSAYYVHETGWLLTNEEPHVEALTDCPAKTVTVTPQPTEPGPVVIDVSRRADRRYSETWWQFDLDGNGSLETLSRDGVVETEVHTNRLIDYGQCDGRVFDETVSCPDTNAPVFVGVGVAAGPPLLSPQEWLALNPPAEQAAPPPGAASPSPGDPGTARRSGLSVTVPQTADLQRALRRGVRVTVLSRRAARVRLELRSAHGVAGRRTVDVAAGARRRVTVALRRSFVKRARRARRATLRLRVSGAGLAHRTTIVLRRRAR